MASTAPQALYDTPPVGCRTARALGYLLLLHGVAASVPGLVNVSLFRVSPLDYPGVMNMDTGDPGGDIEKFGHGQAAVPPTVSEVTRRVGVPSPTGTPWPSLPHVPGEPMAKS